MVDHSLQYGFAFGDLHAIKCSGLTRRLKRRSLMMMTRSSARVVAKALSPVTGQGISRTRIWIWIYSEAPQPRGEDMKYVAELPVDGADGTPRMVSVEIEHVDDGL